MQTFSTKVTVEFAKRVAATEQKTLVQDGDTTIDILVELCHHAAVRNFWWHDISPYDDTKEVDVAAKEMNFAERIALCHSELSEALEGARRDLQSDHITGFSMVEEELADTLIRIFDLAGGLGSRLGEAFVAKMIYNQERQDHKIEARMASGGKGF